MNSKPYLVAENYFPKEECFDELMDMLKETSEMIKLQDGALMSMALKPEQKNGPTNRDNFMDLSGKVSGIYEKRSCRANHEIWLVGKSKKLDNRYKGKSLYGRAGMAC